MQQINLRKLQIDNFKNRKYMRYLKQQTMHKIKLTIVFALLIPMAILGQTATEIAKTSIKSTVSIIALDNMGQPLGHGSGFILDNELIVTNVHVLEGCVSAYVLLDGQGKKYKVSGYVAIDRANDLAIIKVPELYGNKIKLGTEFLPEIGEKIYAVGNPKGFNGTFSEGIISGIRDLKTSEVLQITAPISPGSSGGPVLNSSGNVVGIAFASYTDGQNLNFAIPVKYLINLKSKIGTLTSLSTVKSQPKTAKSISPNIKEGVVVRNIKRFGNGFEFSIKNNLPYTVRNVTILFLGYDATGTVIDYREECFFRCTPPKYNYGYRTETLPKEKCQIPPYLAKMEMIISESFIEHPKIIARILDFEIIEE